MRLYRLAGAPPRRRPINEDELVRDLHRVCRYVLGKHPFKHYPSVSCAVCGADSTSVWESGRTHGCPVLVGAVTSSLASARGSVRLGDG